MILPFDNKLKLCAIKGSDLISKFLNNSDYHTYSTISASQVDKNATYYIVADSWTADYYWAKCTPIEVYDDTTFARDLLAVTVKEFLSQNNTHNYTLSFCSNSESGRTKAVL